VDESAYALDALKRNAALGGADGETIVCVKDDVFAFLTRLERQGASHHASNHASHASSSNGKELFDIIILDPPAFAKSRTQTEDAVRGYREINRKAIALLAPGGILVSCSCSQAVDEWRFKSMIAASARDAGRRLQELSFRGQPADHPVLLGYDESHYLKCGIYGLVP
jgi:23S rRNA (cytosine1962-C5)-methyltransferase